MIHQPPRLRDLIGLRIVNALLCGAIVLPAAGCGFGAPKMGNVTGKVTYSDGSIPAAGIAVIRFEVAPDSTTEKRKAADSDILSDGSYNITTLRSGDGAYYGKYKVVFTILKDYRSGKSLVDSKYTSADTTPYECVVDSPSQEIDFTIEKAK